MYACMITCTLIYISCEQSSEPRKNNGLVPRPMHALPVAWERDCAIRNLNMGIELGLGMWVE